MSEDGWSTDDDLLAARERFAAQIPGYRAPVAYALARRDADGLRFGHVNQVGAARGLPAVALAVACGYVDRTGSFPLGKSEVEAVLRRLAPAEAATHVRHPNIWSWRELVDAAEEEQQFVAFYLADEGDGPITAEEAEFLRRARGES